MSAFWNSPIFGLCTLVIKFGARLSEVRRCHIDGVIEGATELGGFDGAIEGSKGHAGFDGAIEAAAVS